MPAKRIKPLSTDVMSVAEAARRTQLSPTTIKKGIRNRKFPGYQIETRFIIPRLWFQRFLNGEWAPERKENEEAA